MASSIALNQAQILSLIDIPKFSDDLRLLILEYMHARRVTKFIWHDKIYWLRLTPYLEDNKLSLQIVAHNDKTNILLSTFGTYCDEKAIHEYNTLRDDMPSPIPLESWDRALFRCVPKDDGIIHSRYVFYIRYVFCPDDGCTIMFLLKIRPARNIEFSTYHTNTNITVIDDVKKCHETTHRWISGTHRCEYYSKIQAVEEFLQFHNLALSYGKNWYINRTLNESRRHEIITETFNGNEHKLCTQRI